MNETFYFFFSSDCAYKLRNSREFKMRKILNFKSSLKGWFGASLISRLLWDSKGLLGKTTQSEALEFCLVLRNKNTI